MVDISSSMIEEITLSSTALILVYVEFTVIIELTEIIVKGGYADCSCIVVFPTLSIAVVDFYLTVTCQCAAF